MAKYCKLCSRNVQPIKKFNWIWFIFLFVFTAGYGAGFYFIWYMLFKSSRCPICNKKL